MAEPQLQRTASSGVRKRRSSNPNIDEVPGSIPPAAVPVAQTQDVAIPRKSVPDLKRKTSVQAVQELSGPTTDLWEQFQVFFSHDQLVTIAKKFDECNARTGRTDYMGISIPSLCELVKAVEPQCIPTTEAEDRVDSSKHHGGSIGESLERCQVDVVAGVAAFDFDGLVGFIKDFIEHEFKRRPRSLFTREKLEEIEDVFRRYDHEIADGTSTGLKTNQTFEVWKELGFGADIETRYQQQIMIERIKEVDIDFSGTVNFEEFLQLLRIYKLEKQEKQKKYEYDHVKQSNFTTAEVSELREIFSLLDTEKTGQLAFTQVRQLFHDLGGKLSREEVDQLYDFIDEVMEKIDQNFNQLIDFGEFLMIMRQILDSNFLGIKDKCAGLLGKAPEYAPSSAMDRILAGS
mmetsp:Transcript_763/g.1207  ORF Transcript_763/g.1207 Transcript_763/m.1207 type:complete len:403 (-) Transcript_763:182-1390(-)